MGGSNGQPPGDEVDAGALIAKALSHWLRVEILAILNEREASAKEMADELDMPLSNVSYHVKELHKTYRLIVLVEKVPVRGATEKRYRALNRAMLPPEVWDRVPDDQKHLVDVGILRELWVDITASMEKGLFDGLDSHLSITPMLADEQGIREGKAALDEVLQQLMRIAKESSKRLKEPGAKGRAWTAGIAGFSSVRDPDLGMKNLRKPRKGTPRKKKAGAAKQKPKGKKG